MVKRYSVRCGFCKERWMEDVSDPHAFDASVFGKNHACAKMLQVRLQAEETATYKKSKGDWRLFADLVDLETGVYAKLTVTPLKWKRLSEPTKCGPRCTGATGSSCDCQCQGKNHGANKVI